MNKLLDRDTCGVGRCKAVPDMTVWSVPICQPHWNQCCEEMPNGSSLRWLHKKAKADFRSSLPDPSVADPPLKVSKPVRVAKPIRVARP